MTTQARGARSSSVEIVGELCDSRSATHMLAFEEESELVWFAGNYKEHEADLHQRKGAEADQPKRIEYKKLVTG